MKKFHRATFRILWLQKLLDNCNHPPSRDPSLIMQIVNKLFRCSMCAQLTPFHEFAFSRRLLHGQLGLSSLVSVPDPRPYRELRRDSLWFLQKRLSKCKVWCLQKSRKEQFRFRFRIYHKRQFQVSISPCLMLCLQLFGKLKRRIPSFWSPSACLRTENE